MECGPAPPLWPWHLGCRVVPGPHNEDLDQIELGAEVVHARVVRPDFVGLREMGLTCLGLDGYATMDPLGSWCPGRSCQVIA